MPGSSRGLWQAEFLLMEDQHAVLIRVRPRSRSLKGDLLTLVNVLKGQRSKGALWGTQGWQMPLFQTSNNLADEMFWGGSSEALHLPSLLCPDIPLHICPPNMPSPATVA